MRKIIIVSFLALWAGSLLAQEVEVTGAITDPTQIPLAGVSITIKDQAGLGTASNAEGHYKIKTDPYSILIFSYVGYKTQEIKVGQKTLVNVVLQPADSSIMDQVVVTATGVKRKITETGAITTVNVSDLRVPTANLTNALAGNVAGVIAMQTSGEPGFNNSQFWIRGMSTFGANQGALIMVDGFERPFNEINIEDIESFSVLKDASATALYGSKGANGVILITTKNGRAGKITIDGRVQAGYVARTRTPEYVDGYEYAQLVNEARVTRNQEPLYSANELEIIKYKLDPDLYPNVDWMNLMLRPYTNNVNAAVNFKGGGTTARYFVSAAYFNEGGMYESDESLKEYKTNANRQRWNYRTNFDFDITKTTLLRLGVAGFLEKKNSPGLGHFIWESVVGTNPIATPVLYSNGLVPAYGTAAQTNPWVLTTQTGYKEFWQNNINTNVNLEQRLDFITKGLRAVARVAFDADSRNEIYRQKWPEQFYVERRRDRNGNLVMLRRSTEALLFQTSAASGTRILELNGELVYNRNFSGHNVDALVRTFRRESRSSVSVGTDIANGIPNRNVSVSGHAGYAFRNKYLAAFDFGYTGSENFRVGRQFGFFPAFSGGWVLSEEKFLKNVPWLDLLKVRYSHGWVGNDNLGRRFAYLSTIDYYRNNENVINRSFNFGELISPNIYNALGYQQVGSDQLTWETGVKKDLGLEINILKNMFTFYMDFFEETRDDIFIQRNFLPAMVGISSSPYANVGKTENRGFDGNFSFHKRLHAVDFTARGNITYYKNKIIERDEQYNFYPYLSQEGFRLDQSSGLIAEGLFKDYEEIRNSAKQTYGPYMPGDIKYKDVNGDGVINDDDIVPIGASFRPALIYGLGMSASWKGVDFNIHFQGAGRSSYFLNGPSVYPFIQGSWGNILTEVADPSNRWISSAISGDPRTENPNAKYPRLSYNGSANNYRASTYWLRDGQYLRLKTLELGYSFPKLLLQRFRMSGARVYVIGQNLFVWDKLKVWDPELASGNGMAYPPSKTITVGLNLTL
ncbi:SusC/RagA family TonB-linked outer membrane protein [Niabella beijingensis]|uniref:SusC/RagA family TonB-linked outer membrane protein n=1 Tax=Niabella beijingensis TaxID=2872700 RepID=UPI001CC18DEC|nr:TonB-dependent receptor [Niabella beijingensis]MBZ4191696.1 TonB-dependent receptor [Niabella beijingensis]